jgi:tetratricopeptide (TPR) repeat protein
LNFSRFFAISSSLFRYLVANKVIVSRETDDAWTMTVFLKASVFGKIVRAPGSGREIGDGLATSDKIVSPGLDLHNNVIQRSAPKQLLDKIQFRYKLNSLRRPDMKRGHSFIYIAFFTVLCFSPARPQERDQHDHHHDASEKIGRVNFPVSCGEGKQFNRAVAWLHSFEYEEAERAFTAIGVADPKCGMAYWGIAMSNYHPIWAPPTPAELKKGLAAVERAQSAGAQTQRERDYIAAIEVFYKDSDKLDHKTRALAYSEAMEKVYHRYPKDREAAVFYALTLIWKGMMANDKSYANEKSAAEILNGVLAAEPEHPGVAHYIIHSLDYPPLANLALPAARSYAKIAPASAHARHMPSHIFTRLGLWQDSIQSNLDSAAAAKAYAAKNRLAGAWDQQLHAMDYLVYAYLQGAQDKKAWGMVDELNKIEKVEPETFVAAYAFSAIPARYALERRQWEEAAGLTVAPGSFPWDRFRWAEAHIYCARAIGAARSGKPDSTREDVNKLAEIRQSIPNIKGAYDWGKQVEIQFQVATGWLAFAEGKKDEAVRLMRAAADLEDSTDKHPVTPGAILPAREQLGDLLLETAQAAQALSSFEAALRVAPNRFNGLYGAARAAELAGDRKKAAGYYAQLVKLCERADGTRPELEQAKVFLAKK